MPTATRDTVIRNKLGLHARPAMQFVELANQFQSTVRVETLADPPADADGKSVMQMIVLAAVEGTPMRISASGADAQMAVDKLTALINDGFGEEM